MVVNVVQMTMRGTPLQAVVASIREFEQVDEAVHKLVGV